MADDQDPDRFLVRRSTVQPGLAHSAYREELRSDFVYTCAYCTMAETEAMAYGFEIDHWKPQTHGGTDDYVNLYWSCSACNQKKKGYWPKDQAAEQAGQRILRVDLENPEEHYASTDDDPTRVQGKSNLGRFNIELLGLNMARMIKLRSMRHAWGYNTDLIRRGLRALAQLRIDDLPPELKARAIKIREQLKKSADDAVDAVDKVMARLVEESCKSELLGLSDPPDAVRQREAYLRSIGVMKPKAKRKS